MFFFQKRNSSEIQNIFDVDRIEKIRGNYARFIKKCSTTDGRFRLTPSAEPSAFARCFGLFGLNLLESDMLSNYSNDQTAIAIRDDLEALRLSRLNQNVDLAFDKPYLQLLCFSLSALSVINKLNIVQLDDHVLPLVNRDIIYDLDKCGALRGIPSSGNLAMFFAILRLYANEQLGVNCKLSMNNWIRVHMAAMNAIGFWEQRNTVTYSQFQNGYHQYEIFEYLGIEGNYLIAAAKAVADLCDSDGHFGPLPGGGGCYDYDAGSILLAGKRYSNSQDFDETLARLASSILLIQNNDGGFCETKDFRPFSWRKSKKILRHVIHGPCSAMPEKLYQLASLSRPSFDKITTHWSEFSRSWDESNLWDSWFRVMIFGRIQLTLRPQLHFRWAPINFPGIGFF
jgi:hypothetical protein